MLKVERLIATYSICEGGLLHLEGLNIEQKDFDFNQPQCFGLVVFSFNFI